MESYLTTIEEKLGGKTPKESFEKLEKIYDLLNAIAYPRRGTHEEILTIHDVAEIIQGLIAYEP